MSSESRYPASGHIYEVRFGDLAYRLDFNADGQHMTFSSIGTSQPVAEPTVTVRYTAVGIRPDVFMVYWTEPDGSTVVHVEDFERETVHTNITLPNHTFLNFTGSLKRVS